MKYERLFAIRPIRWTQYSQEFVSFYFSRQFLTKSSLTRRLRDNVTSDLI